MRNKHKLPPRFKLFGLFECVSNSAAQDAFLCTQNALTYFRSKGLPFVKVGGQYAYPVELCHRFFAGQDYRYGLNEIMSFVNRAHNEKLPPDKWLKPMEGGGVHAVH